MALHAIETVLLHGGLCVQLEALKLLWHLEDRGFSITSDAGGLLVAPRSRLTPADDQALRRHRDELLQLVNACESGSIQ